MALTARVALAAALSLTLLLVFATPPADAGPRSFRIGVMDDLVAPQGNLAAMDRAGVDVFRTVLNWTRVETDGGRVGRCDNAFDWSAYDALVAEAGRRGVSLLPVVLGSPGYAAERPQSAPSTRSPAIRDYKCFLRAAVERYGRGGDFITRQQALGRPVQPLKQWQIWNETNLRLFASEGGVDAREYGRFLKLSSNQIRKRDRRATIVLGGLPERPRSPRHRADKFLKRMYRVKRVERSFDAVAIHPYAENARGVKGGLLRVRRMLRRLGDARRPLWVTEIGWSTYGPEDSFLVKSEKGQAKELRRTFRMLKRNRGRLKLGTVNWFRWRDADTPPGNRSALFDYAGLYRENGNPKPACRRFVRFTGGGCAPIADGTGVAATSTVDRARAAQLRPSRLP